MFPFGIHFDGTEIFWNVPISVIESIRKVKISKKIQAINLNFQRKILIVKKKKIIRIKRNLKMKQNTSDNTKVQLEKIPVIIKKKKY